MACTMKDVRKGTKVQLRNGNIALVMDNLTNRATRMCQVYGTYTDMGSVYTSDIYKAFIGENWEFVTHTPQVLATAKSRQLAGW